MTRYAVLRHHPGIPPEHRSSVEGLWIEIDPFRFTYPGEVHGTEGDVTWGAYAVPTGRIETRDDGAVAEVYEFRKPTA